MQNMGILFEIKKYYDVNDISRLSVINEEYEENDYDVNVPFELEGCYGYENIFCDWFIV